LSLLCALSPDMIARSTVVAELLLHEFSCFLFF
jgi:hypothetical protein